MKISFCSSVFKDDEMEDALIRLGRLGYDGVELWDQYLKVSDIDKLKTVLEESSLSVAQLCPYFDFTGSKEKWHESLEIVGRYIEYAKILDAKLIRVFTGSVGSNEATEAVWRQAIEGLREMCIKGKEFEISFALETHPGSLMDSSSSTLKLLEDVSCSNLGVNLQVPLDSEDVYQSAEILGKHVIHIHAHNWSGPAPNGCWEKLTYLESGDLDFPRFLGILHRHGFDGYISIEHGTHQGRDDPYHVAEQELGYLRTLVNKL